MEAPKRPYEMIITIGADDLKGLANGLDNILFDIYGYIEHGHQNPHVCTSGSPSCGYSFSLTRTEVSGHEEYFKKLEEYLAETRKKKLNHVCSNGPCRKWDREHDACNSGGDPAADVSTGYCEAWDPVNKER
jgi:hypothetical protein